MQKNQISSEILFPLFCELFKQSQTYDNGWSREYFQKQFYIICFRNSSLYICHLLLDNCLHQCLNIKKRLYKSATVIAEYKLPFTHLCSYTRVRQAASPTTVYLPTIRPQELPVCDYHFFMLPQSCDLGYLKTLHYAYCLRATWEKNTMQPLWKLVWRLLRRTKKNCSMHNHSLLGKRPKDNHRDICTSMPTPCLFPEARKRNQTINSLAVHSQWM